MPVHVPVPVPVPDLMLTPRVLDRLAVSRFLASPWSRPVFGNGNGDGYGDGNECTQTLTQRVFMSSAKTVAWD
jgi:hypothetical protein